jgi:hypothetical protein
MARKRSSILVVSIPFPLSSSPGASAQESAGRLINCYAEPLGQGRQRGQAFQAACGGLAQMSRSVVVRGIGKPGFRGSILVDNTLYAAWSGKVSKFTPGCRNNPNGVADRNRKGFLRAQQQGNA